MRTDAGDRFTTQILIDCEFCPTDGRQFRTHRHCSGCGKALCLSCRPEVRGRPTLCPDCGGGAPEAALEQPEAAVNRILNEGLKPPYWLLALRERKTVAPLPGSFGDITQVPGVVETSR